MEANRTIAPSKSLTSNSAAPIVELQRRDPSKAPTATIFGFLPYWGSSEHLRYDLLTHIACAAVEVNGDGTLGNDHGWPWTGVINEAHQHGVRVVLVATLFDTVGILELVTSPIDRATFFANIHGKMLEGGADGLNIDFEGSGTSWQTHMPGFMAELTAYLHAAQPGSEVTIDGPAVNWSGAWDLVALADGCDGIFIMGYDFYGSWSSTTGPVAPLTGGSFNINDTVRNQYAAVQQWAPEKLILGVPYYGAHWTTVSSEPRSPVSAWVGHPTYASATSYAETHGTVWDAVSQTPWVRWHDGTSWHQVWFDTAMSLGLKYDLVSATNLQGVGMWALGYDADRPELWEALESRFIETTAPVVPALPKAGIGILVCLIGSVGVVVLRCRRRPCPDSP